MLAHSPVVVHIRVTSPMGNCRRLTICELRGGADTARRGRQPGQNAPVREHTRLFVSRKAFMDAEAFKFRGLPWRVDMEASGPTIYG